MLQALCCQGATLDVKFPGTPPPLVTVSRGVEMLLTTRELCTPKR